MRLLGITMAYNEADCIERAVMCLGRSGHEVHLFDHGSTDNTAELAQAQAKADGFPLHVHPVSRRVSFRGQLFGKISAFVRSQGSRFDWVTWIAADEIIRPLEGGDLAREHLERLWGNGYRVLKPKLREFWITDADPPEGSVPDYIQRIRYFRPRPDPNCPRGWAITLTGRMPHGLHRRDREWPKGTRINSQRWFLDHYPIRTFAQGERRIMKERPWVPEHYRKFHRAKCENLMKRATDLVRVEEEELIDA